MREGRKSVGAYPPANRSVTTAAPLRMVPLSFSFPSARADSSPLCTDLPRLAEVQRALSGFVDSPAARAE